MAENEAGGNLRRVHQSLLIVLQRFMSRDRGTSFFSTILNFNWQNDGDF
jgi:hypothetical protein